MKTLTITLTEHQLRAVYSAVVKRIEGYNLAATAQEGNSRVTEWEGDEEEFRVLSNLRFDWLKDIERLEDLERMKDD